MIQQKRKLGKFYNEVLSLILSNKSPLIVGMLDKKIHLNDDKQFKFLQEGINRILSIAQILLVL